MPEHQQTQKDNRRKAPQTTPRTPEEELLLAHTVDPPGNQQGTLDPRLMSPARVRYLQRTIGNAAVQRLLAEQSGDESVSPPPAPSFVSSLLQRKPPEEEDQENNTGLPDTLKSGLEHLSSLSMDDVQTHYNSDKPGEVQALAFTQRAPKTIASAPIDAKVSLGAPPVIQRAPLKWEETRGELENSCKSPEEAQIIDTITRNGETRDRERKDEKKNEQQHKMQILGGRAGRSAVQRKIFTVSGTVNDGKETSEGSLDKKWAVYRSIDVALAENSSQAVYKGKALGDIDEKSAGEDDARVAENEDIYLVGHGMKGMIGTTDPKTVAEKVDLITPLGWDRHIYSFNCYSAERVEGGVSGIEEFALASKRPGAKIHGPKGASQRILGAAGKHGLVTVTPEEYVKKQIPIPKHSFKMRRPYQEIRQAAWEAIGEPEGMAKLIKVWKQKSPGGDTMVAGTVKEKAQAATEAGKEVKIKEQMEKMADIAKEQFQQLRIRISAGSKLKKAMRDVRVGQFKTWWEKEGKAKILGGKG